MHHLPWREKWRTRTGSATFVCEGSDDKRGHLSCSITGHESQRRGKPRQQSAAPIRLLMFATLAVGEMLVTSLLYALPNSPALLNPSYYVRQLALLCVASALAFVVVSWPIRRVLVSSWLAQVRPGGWRLPFVVNIALFAVLTTATAEFSRYVAIVDRPPWGLFSAYLVLLATTGLSLLWLAAPIVFWRMVLTHHRREMRRRPRPGSS